MSREIHKIERFSLDDVIPYILPEDGDRRWFITSEGSYPVKLSGWRLRLHSRGQSCVCCGLLGTHYWLEENNGGSAHLNLYGRNDQGHEIMLTVDHILPVSKGGKNDDNNLQLLCEPCNRLKSNRIITVPQLRALKEHPFLPVNAQLGDWVVLNGNLHAFSGYKYRPDTFGLVVGHSKKTIQIWIWCQCLTRCSSGLLNCSRIRIRHAGFEEVNALINTHDQCPDNRSFLKGHGYEKCKKYLIGEKTNYLPYPVQVALAQAGAQ